MHGAHIHCDQHAEEALLGDCLISPSKIPMVAGLVDAADFYDPYHCRVFEVISAMFNRGDHVGVIAVSGHLSNIDGVKLAHLQVVADGGAGPTPGGRGFCHSSAKPC
ncbi:MAG: hypothetical protein NVSMB16_06410 [Acidimicrobiales bacterium]